jgi:hypothetical protein
MLWKFFKFLEYNYHLSLRNIIETVIFKCFQIHSSIFYLFMFLDLLKILFISLMLLHLKYWLILILDALIYTEVNYKIDFISKLNSNHIFMKFLLMKALLKTLLIWSTLIFETLIKFLILSTKTLNQNNIWWKNNFIKQLLVYDSTLF